MSSMVGPSISTRMRVMLVKEANSSETSNWPSTIGYSKSRTGRSPSAIAIRRMSASVPSAGLPPSTNIIEPRLIRTPSGLDSGKPEDIRNPSAFVTAFGTETMPVDALESIRDALFVTRTVDRGLSFERPQALEKSRTAPGQTDEQIQLRVTPDGQNVYAVWIRKDGDQSDVMFNSAVGITPTADLSVAIDASATAPDVGDSVEVEARIDNIGPHSATELQLSMSLPAGLELVSATPSSGACELTAQVTCEFDELVAGSSATVGLSFVAATRGSWPLAAEVSAWEIDPEPALDAAEVVIAPIPHADISLTMAARDSVVRNGDVVEFDYEVANSGPQVAQGAVVSFTIPASATVSVPPRCQSDGELLTCEVPDIAVGDSWQDTLVVHAAKVGVARITATVEPQEDDHDKADNTVATSALILTVSGEDKDSGAGSGFALLLILFCSLAWRFGSPAIARRTA